MWDRDVKFSSAPEQEVLVSVPVSVVLGDGRGLLALGTAPASALPLRGGRLRPAESLRFLLLRKGKRDLRKKTKT